MQLLKTMAEVVDDEFHTVQGSTVHIKGSKDLGNFILSKCGPTVDLNDTIPVYPPVLKPIEQFMDGFENVLSAEEKAEIGNWQHSSLIDDPDLQSEALLAFAEPRDETVNFDDVWDMAVSMLWTNDNELREKEPLSEEALYDLPTNRNASGVLPLDPMFGKVQGSKEEMIDAATKVALSYKRLSPCTVSAKPEVLKKGKKVRYIVLEPQNLFLLSMFYFWDHIKIHGPVVNGDCRGLSTMRGGSLKPWYHLLFAICHEDGIEFEDALKVLKDVGINESDKTKWEYTVNTSTAWAFVLWMMAVVKPDQSDKKTFSNLLAHQLIPYIQISGQSAFPAYGRMISGTAFTLLRNCFMHSAAVQTTLLNIQRHDGKLGGCGCRFCEECEFQVDERQIRLLSAFNVVGDDFLGINYEAQGFNKMVDILAGTITKTEILPAFGEPGQRTAKFLQRQLRVKDGRLSTFRDWRRLVGKLMNGSSRVNPEDFTASVLAMAFEAGDNEQAYDIAKRLYDASSEEIQNYNEFLLNLEEHALDGQILETSGTLPPFSAIKILQNENQKAICELMVDWRHRF